LELRHIAGLVCSVLDLALTPTTIKSGFAATGIAPFNLDIFTDADFIQAVQQNAEEAAIETDLHDDDRRRIIVVDSLDAVNETNNPTTSRGASTMSQDTSYSSILDEIGPLQAAIPKKPSNRGRKAMESSELTSPESIAFLQEKVAKKAATVEKQAALAAKKATAAANKEALGIKKGVQRIKRRRKKLRNLVSV